MVKGANMPIRATTMIKNMDERLAVEAPNEEGLGDDDMEYVQVQNNDYSVFNKVMKHESPVCL